MATTVFKVSLPKNAGSVEVNAKMIPAEVLDFALEHGFRQKLADIAVNMHVKATRKDPKDSDELFESPDALVKAIREKAQTLLARWAGGEWSLEGGGTRADPVGGEVWSILLSVLDIPVSKRADARRLGKPELALRIAEAKGYKRGTEAADKAAAGKVLAAVQRKAEEIVKKRTALSFEL